MAANTLNNYDDNFINDLLLAGVPTASVAAWTAAWKNTEPTYNKKADYMYAMYKSALTNKSVDATALLNAAGTWAQSYNPDLINPVTKKPYNLVAFKNAVQELTERGGSLGNTSPNANTHPVLAQIHQARQLQGEIIAASLGDNLTGAEITASAKAIMNGSATNQFDPDAIRTQYINAVGKYAVKSKDTAATLEARYGGLKNSSGKPLFTSDDFKQVIAGGEDTKLAFNDKIQSYVDKVITTTNGDLANKTGSLAYRTAANALLNNTSKLVDSYNSNVAKLTKDATTGDWAKTSTTTTPTDGITGLLPKGSYKDANGNFAYTGGQIDSKDMAAFTQSYNPNKGVYRAPTLGASGKLVSNPTSPYSNILNGMLSNYKDPFASGYTSSLDSMQPAAMTSTQLASLSKPFTTNATASDLVKLANSAGGEYDPTNKAGSTLPPALRQLYQNQTLPDDTVKAKPGVPDPTKMKVPEANFLDLNGDLLYGDIAGGDLTNTPMEGDAKTAAESAYGFTPDTTLKNVPGATITNESGTLTKPVITDKATADALHKAEQDRIAKEAADKAEADKKASYYNADGTLTGLGFYTYNPTGNYQDYLDKIAADKAAADTDTGGIKTLADKAAADKIIADKAAADKIIADKAAADKAIADKAAADKAATDKAIADKAAAYKILADKIAAEREARGIKTLADKAAADKIITDKAAADKAAADKIIADKAAADKAAAEQLAPIPKTDAQLLGTKWTSADIDSGELTFDELTRLRELNSAAGKTNGTKSLDPYTTMDATGWTPEQLAPKGAVGIAGNPNVGSFTSADNMNTSATGVGAPITSLLTPNTGASGTPPVTQKPAVANEPDTGGIKTLADKAAADKIIADKAAADKAAADKAIADKAAADKAAADKIIADKAAADKAAADKAAADKAAADKATVVGSPSGVNAFSAQTVALPPSGPQPINPSNGGPTSAIVDPITAAQRDLGPLNISNLGAVIGPQAMNSNAGGVASLVGPQVTVQPQPQPQPAVTYTYEPSSQQQLEDKAVSAGYQGDYTDTAAMQSFLNEFYK